MNNFSNLENEEIKTGGDNWFDQWVEEMVDDFEQVELDEFILMD